MIVTEEEAKTKRCQESYPAAYGVSEGGGAYATAWQYPPPPSGSSGAAIFTAPLFCIGSACMAWRWRRDAYGPDGCWQHSDTFGYCGKAGKP